MYETYPPARARESIRGLETHYTPKHGSWLNIAEIELSVLDKQKVGSQSSIDINTG
jgi:hypothetical protein